MRCRSIGTRTIWLLAVVGSLLALPAVVFAQGGVAVDAEGVLRTKSLADVGGQLTKDRIAAARTSLNPKVATYSRLRYISLKHLEQAIAQSQGVPSEEMRNLAGLLRLHYVFLYPDSNDIVIAGPAEGWATDGFGRAVGLNSGRPTIQLQDLVVALRAFPPQGSATKFIGCSIDPTKEGLVAMQQFLRSIGSVNPSVSTEGIVEGLQTSLGLQTVRVDGVSPKTHFAMVMVEADYRMKLIGIGLEKPPVHMVSYVDGAKPAAVARNAMQRWYFTPDYQCVRASADGMAMELVGDGVKLIGQDELVSSQGQRQSVAQKDAASQAFVTSFTKHYSELAERSPVYAQLRNLIDLAVGAAYMQQQDYYGKAQWKMELLGNEQSFAVETYDAPKQVATAVNAIWRDRRLMTPVGGGVSIDATRAIEPDKRLADQKGTVAKAREQTKIKLAKGQWWWD